MFRAIHNNSTPAWWCDNCKLPHQLLYINTHDAEDFKKWDYYCEDCVPRNIKEKAVHEQQGGN